MKHRFVFLLAIGLFAHAAPAQTSADTSTIDSAAIAEPKQERAGKKFIDEDGDGIDDRLAGGRKKLRRGMDKFIDRDGDGICDDRASGLGFRRGKAGSRGGASTTGKAKGRGGRR